MPRAKPLIGNLAQIYPDRPRNANLPSHKFPECFWSFSTSLARLPHGAAGEYGSSGQPKAAHLPQAGYRPRALVSSLALWIGALLGCWLPRLHGPWH